MTEEIIDLKNMTDEQIKEAFEKEMNKETELNIDQIDPKARKRILRMDKLNVLPTGTLEMKGTYNTEVENEQ